MGYSIYMSTEHFAEVPTYVYKLGGRHADAAPRGECFNTGRTRAPTDNAIIAPDGKV